MAEQDLTKLTGAELDALAHESLTREHEAEGCGDREAVKRERRFRGQIQMEAARRRGKRKNEATRDATSGK